MDKVKEQKADIRKIMSFRKSLLLLKDCKDKNIIEQRNGLAKELFNMCERSSLNYLSYYLCIKVF